MPRLNVRKAGNEAFLKRRLLRLWWPVVLDPIACAVQIGSITAPCCTAATFSDHLTIGRVGTETLGVALWMGAHFPGGFHCVKIWRGGGGDGGALLTP